MTAEKSKKGVKISYKDLQLLIGLSGIAFPFVLVIGYWINNWLFGNGDGFQFVFRGSLSSYYYTPMRNVFVGTLVTVGIFLIVYIGYPSEEDNRLGNWAGFLVIVTALAPTSEHGAKKVPENYIHLTAASIFFILLAYYCLVLFRRTDQPLLNPPLPTGLIQRIFAEAIRTPKFQDEVSNQNKIKRNRIYKFCGWIIVCSIMMSVTLYFVDRYVVNLAKTNFALYLESINSEAFGVAWVVKSEKWFWKDKII